ncbi:MAG TPA: MFS transporter [Pseudomonadales bacterium]
MRNRHIERIWLAQSFVDDLVLAYPVYAIMMLEHGVGAFELTVLFVIWSASALVFEIPSGVLGDLLDRRRYALVGSLIRACGFLLWLVWPSFPGFAAGFVLWSMGSAIHSGTLQALLYDVLAEQGRTQAFARIYGRGRALGSAGVLTAMAIGGYVAETGYTAVLLLSALAPAVSGALIVGLISEPARTHAQTGAAEPAFTATLNAAVRALRTNRALARVSVMFVGLVALFGTIDEFPGTLLAEQGVMSLGTIGLLYGAFLGAQSLGSALAHRLHAVKLGRIAVVSAFAHCLLLGALAAGAWLAWPQAGVLLCTGVCLYFGIMGAVEVLLETGLQHEIDVGARATITSFSGAAMEVCGILLYLVIGAVADIGSWSAALAVVAAIAIVLSVGFVYSAGPSALRSRS